MTERIAYNEYTKLKYNTCYAGQHASSLVHSPNYYANSPF